ncbi:MAG: hypothetical protein BRD30_01180 [Bacteroidetes bacterium QH_2_63_10]|nr:MAG: hypothetical protein BRD30_01180 [Bacteroidetes bacterium QH_2_63_10]
MEALRFALLGGLLFAILVGCRTLDGPTPVEELVPADTALDLQAYEESMPTETDSTSVLILGTPHLAQDDRNYSEREVGRVVEALSAYDPDMLVAEYLPPDHPHGKGRDYRPALDLDSLAAAWDLSLATADSVRRAYRNRDGWPKRPCRLAKAHLLNYDLANAHYYAHANGCADLSGVGPLRAHFAYLSQGETARVGYPIARSHDLQQLVPFDYRGADVSWFIHEPLLEALKTGQVWALWHFWPMMPRVGGIDQEYRARRDGHEDCYADVLRFDNSPEQMALQYWAYERRYPTIDWQGVEMGAEQTERYWRRNRKMFARMQDAIKARDAERVLVIVGSGHKYFLDKLTREADYRWVDPREWLPHSCGAAPERTSAE